MKKKVFVSIGSSTFFREFPILCHEKSIRSNTCQYFFYTGSISIIFLNF